MPFWLAFSVMSEGQVAEKLPPHVGAGTKLGSIWISLHEVGKKRFPRFPGGFRRFCSFFMQEEGCGVARKKYG